LTPRGPGLLDLGSLLDQHRLASGAEEPLEHDGWSGARLTRLTRADGERFILKRDSLALDWIARATDDTQLREARLVIAQPTLPRPVRLPHLGVARDGDGVAILMPDLSETLIPWEQPIGVGDLERVLDALATLHRNPWSTKLSPAFPWCDLERRLLLLTRRSAATYEAEGNPVGERFRLGWEAFDRQSSPPARSLIARLTADASPLIAELARLPVAGLHGDLKLGNVGLAPDGAVDLIDWQMTLVAPVALELGWFLVANVAGLPLPPDELMERYRGIAGLPDDAVWETQRDLAIVVGLLLRGWRKGLDAEAGLTLPDGRTARDDLDWWCSNAVAAAERRGLGYSAISEAT
jgi:hypothetical protein